MYILAMFTYPEKKKKKREKRERRERRKGTNRD
jgi:hypothetical protein